MRIPNAALAAMLALTLTAGTPAADDINEVAYKMTALAAPSFRERKTTEKRFRFLLSNFPDRCDDVSAPLKAADMIVKVHQMLDETGLDEGLLALTNTLHRMTTEISNAAAGTEIPPQVRRNMGHVCLIAARGYGAGGGSQRRSLGGHLPLRSPPVANEILSPAGDGSMGHRSAPQPPSNGRWRSPPSGPALRPEAGRGALPERTPYTDARRDKPPARENHQGLRTTRGRGGALVLDQGDQIADPKSTRSYLGMDCRHQSDGERRVPGRLTGR